MAGGGGVAGGGGGVVGGSGDAAGNLAGAGVVIKSFPAGDIQGDMPAFEKPRDGQSVTGNGTTVVHQSDQNNRGTILLNGKAPEDIPAAQNDDIIAKQFRQAAMEETDPIAKAKLWNEYRRYKNLPVQEVPVNLAPEN